MAKKTLYLDTRLTGSRRSFITAATPADLVTDILTWLETRKWVYRLSAAYSALLEERVSARRTLRLVYAQAIMALLLFPADFALSLRLLLLLWAALAVWQCCRK